MKEYYFTLGYGIVSAVVAVVDLFMAYVSHRKKEKYAFYLGTIAVSAALVDIFYLISILNKDYFTVSLASSLYFLSIDMLLLSMLTFSIYFTHHQTRDLDKTLIKVLIFYSFFEVAVFLVNPFKEIAVSYQFRDTFISSYSYIKYPLFYAHLFYTYLMVAIIALILIVKVALVPKEYRNQYLYILLGFLLIVLVNAVFLFVPGNTIFELIDVSILAYSLALGVIYWSCFGYAQKMMLKEQSLEIFNNIEQGIVLFDFEGRLAMHNSKAEQLLPGVDFKNDLTRGAFVKYIGIGKNQKEDGYVIQCYVGEDKVPLRCDFVSIKNKKERIVSYLYVLADAALDTDLLTGYENWESFEEYSNGMSKSFADRAVAVFDINGLSVVNSTYGNDVGDQMIISLSQFIRNEFGNASYYVRGREAQLIVATPLRDEKVIENKCETICAAFDSPVQYAIAMNENGKIIEAIETALSAMNNKKLLDSKSAHSHIINSLVKALQESDSDTEAHVIRTRKMGDELAKKLGLSNIQRSDLSLLCLLHDIGKIGIPLDILNKPGKLSKEEWEIVKSHANKGYEIVMSSKELSRIGEMVLHHHERWDGNGYPDGLSRESIPLLSRIIAVVDAYDAMVNDRVYRKAMSSKEALDELKKYAGEQFDPHIVNEFAALIAEQPEIITPVVTGEASSDFYATVSREEPDKTTGHTHTVTFSKYTMDETGQIIDADDNFEYLTGYSKEEIREGRLTHLDLIPKEDRPEYVTILTEKLANSDSCYLEHRIIRKDKKLIYVFCYGRQYFESVSKKERTEIVISNSSESYSVKTVVAEQQKRAKNQLKSWEKTFRKDSLTDLLNRRAFENDVEQRLIQNETKVMMFVMDVDHFKTFNDTYGHKAGDEFLIFVADTIKGALRNEDIASRIGGDEFATALFFKKSTSDEKMYSRAQQIFDRISMTLQSYRGEAGISMGVAIANSEWNTFNILYSKADEALYQSKNNGRGRITISKYRPEEKRSG